MKRPPGFEKVRFIASKRQKDSRDPYSNMFFVVFRPKKIFYDFWKEGMCQNVRCIKCSD